MNAAYKSVKAFKGPVLWNDRPCASPSPLSQQSAVPPLRRVRVPPPLPASASAADAGAPAVSAPGSACARGGDFKGRQPLACFEFRH